MTEMSGSCPLFQLARIAKQIYFQVHIAYLKFIKIKPNNGQSRKVY